MSWLCSKTTENDLLIKFNLLNFLHQSDCPYGDDDSVTVNSERITCSQAVLMYVDICTDTYIKEHCCKTCAATKTGTNPPGI